jgi:predicted component of type VI protein secretion system
MRLILNAIHRPGNSRSSGRKSLNEGKLTLGRAPGNDWLLEDRLVSKQHCVIQKVDEIYQLRDLSTNGTFLNGNLIGKGNALTLAQGDCIEIGDYAFRIKITDDLPLAGDPLTVFPLPLAGDSQWADSELQAAFGGSPGSKDVASLLDDIAPSGATADSILPGINDASLPAVQAILDIDKAINPVGWSDAPDPDKLTDSEAFTQEEPLESIKRPIIPPRNDIPGLDSVVNFTRRAAVLPENWNDPVETNPTGDALTTELTLIRAFARAANLCEADIHMLTSAVRNGRVSAEQTMAHAGGLFRQTAAAIEERLGSIRSKAQSLEYLLPNQAYEQLEATLKQTAVLDLKTAAGNVGGDLVPPAAGGRQQDMLSHIIEDMRLIDNALFTTLLTLSAFTPKSPRQRLDESNVRNDDTIQQK